MPDLSAGYGGRVMTAGALFLEIASRYPKIGKYVHPYHPDLQGPMDAAELICGSDIFCELYESPELIHNLLALICDTYTAFMGKWLALFPANGYAYHFGFMHRGTIMLRDDSAMNLSPAMFEGFILPYDNRLLRQFGGGIIHFCGKGDHFVHFFDGMESLYGINLTQPEYNDMETIYRHTVDRNIKLFTLHPETARAAGNRLKGRASLA